MRKGAIAIGVAISQLISESIVNSQNPNLYWNCDSYGHHCQWKPARSRY